MRAIEIAELRISSTCKTEAAITWVCVRFYILSSAYTLHAAFRGIFLFIEVVLVCGGALVRAPQWTYCLNSEWESISADFVGFSSYRYYFSPTKRRDYDSTTEFELKIITLALLFILVNKFQEWTKWFHYLYTEISTTLRLIVVKWCQAHCHRPALNFGGKHFKPSLRPD